MHCFYYLGSSSLDAILFFTVEDTLSVAINDSTFASLLSVFTEIAPSYSRFPLWTRFYVHLTVVRTSWMEAVYPLAH